MNNKTKLITCLLLFLYLYIDAQKAPETTLELVFSDSTYQLTGVAVSQSGRVFTNYPLWSDSHKYSLVEVTPQNQTIPYPNEEMNDWKPGEDGMTHWVCVQAVYIDDANTMWVVDAASPKMEGVYQNNNKLVKIDMASNTVVRVYPFKGVTNKGSYVNDVRIDTASNYAYLTNSSEGGILVVNLTTGKTREVLKGHNSVLSDPSYVFTIDSKKVERNGKPLVINSDGLAISPNKEYLYYKPLTDNKLYRIKTSHLRNESLSSKQLEKRVEYLGRFTTTDGMEFDKQGNLYIGDIENYRIMKIAPNLKMAELIKDQRLAWPDSYYITKDGYLYISCSQIHKQPNFNKGENKRTSPFNISRIKIFNP